MICQEKTRQDQGAEVQDQETEEAEEKGEPEVVELDQKKVGKREIARIDLGMRWFSNLILSQSRIDSEAL